MRLEHYIRRWLGLAGRRVRSIQEDDDRLHAEIEPIEGRLPRCGCCGRKVRRTKGWAKRRLWRDLKIRKLPLVLAYTPRRVACPDCAVRIEQVPWAQRWSRVTKSLAWAAELARRTGLSTVASQFSINWKTVASIIHRVVQWGLAKRRTRALRIFGIDEVSRKRGHEYLTLVYDLQRGELVWIGKDRPTDTLRWFFDELGRRRSHNLQVVCMDMWAPYRDVVCERAPQATICFDCFDVVRHLGAAVD